MGIKVFNRLPPHIKMELHNPRKFENCLQHFIYAHYFYSLKEYFNIKPETWIYAANSIFIPLQLILNPGPMTWGVFKLYDNFVL
jgi:hypothetical protein